MIIGSLRAALAAAGLTLSCAAGVSAGAAIGPAATIMDGATASPSHGAFVGALAQAGLDGVLRGAGPYTVFAPTDAAFGTLPEGMVEMLSRPTNKDLLIKLLVGHIAPGRVMHADLEQGIAASADGVFRFRAVSGDALEASLGADGIIIRDESGGEVRIAAADAVKSNGIVHVITGVLVAR
jgi:uncharacterized surface protein with fasciclin (FAS1) repeats